ncbi:DNA-deoxyinosine glycosylase [Sphingomonas sp. LaA6.9]|uniref:DNA-deoxyinosine glycosylase n=1 Tax=Sphingomonas sp. LaA6.9 TaxID=2919914 RepID=UPI001F4FF6F2|nr:DNA-deoxyinosine glycosylase [Sphingomonas sp. LaA6.9]MCJ8158990.1 DNA-deoxyinosine glycosylase [Sphingomonas sp. LaA6.9]
MADPPPSDSHKTCFNPVVDGRTRLLILGSLPGEESLRAGQYYANPRNQFWRLLGDVMEIPLADLSYSDRLSTCLDQGVGLWDTVAQAHRKGSLDARIQLERSSDLEALGNALPSLYALAFNGTTAARIGRQAVASDRWILLDLPSSSPAYPLAYGLKLERWMMLRKFLHRYDV